jgi:hypothetical protein
MTSKLSNDDMADPAKFRTRLESINPCAFAKSAEAYRKEKLKIETRFAEESRAFEEKFEREKQQRQQKFQYEIDKLKNEALNEAEKNFISKLVSEVRQFADQREAISPGAGERFLNIVRNALKNATACLSGETAAVSVPQSQEGNRAAKLSHQPEHSNKVNLNKRKQREVGITKREDSAREIQSIKRSRVAGELPKQTQDINLSPAATTKCEGGTITEYERNELIKIIKNALRTLAGRHFRAPARVLWPKFADEHRATVLNPIDLGTIEDKLKRKKYRSIDDFKADIQLLYNNAVLFNGIDHNLARAAGTVRDSILSKLEVVLLSSPNAANGAVKTSNLGA